MSKSFGCRKLALIFEVIGHSPEQFVTHDCNVIFRNYRVSIARKICNTATPVHGSMAKFADR